jgi:hypothetical protein
VKIQHMEPISVVVMDNMMGQHVEEVTRIYDLKGSTFQRIAVEKSPLTVLKDNNLKMNKYERVKINPML